MTEYHSREFVEALHAEQLRLHGGAAGIRDQGMLESALYRPQQREIYDEPDLCELASAYLFGIAKNHPFVDGNKRTAFAAADLFLYFNGLSVEAEQADIIQLVMMVAAGEIDEAGAAAFFRDHVIKVKD
ncbi:MULTISPECIES: type II toxin-antitoxin system death-on-curing family toxin [unclassified Mesorhizobium]|uniref:type II toxin-antitoxin system death-on-curing family toxin n=1 Tax=unclassified Mesorhizobium TaxID=325217 RepID=UPI000FD3E8DA|nr:MULTISPECIES: type II toxin-antitoxin system death-on-curing family toxin [unclassified Mesorhizobium]RVB77881.1 type II toxin-antitoxin system death-on-curing family toxin [Mesorhizobium sp. M6A.T.Cr.TU.014.01.1.1]RWQ07860.1 MAG: type II toxin-antitoxin system death-on-curing family toxin [Mesorhizobium sp.]RWQ08912.1 MAG: type II toxin-antitoxin system death-on-curing family toxin [Mesorhizobium sp.]RWQ65657.1 MAG: type II toxin-antitoxin system death-on-curing family toxin [Mesorhizobium 